MITSVRKNLYWNTLLRIPVRIICFFLSIIVARLLDPSDFGILAITMMCVGYANLITNFGLNGAIIQQTITCNKTMNSIFTVDIVLSLFLALAFAAGAGIISGFFHEPRSRAVIRIMSLVFIITSFDGIPHAILRRDSQFQLLSILEMSKSLATSLLTLLLALLNLGYWALAYGQLVPLLVFTIVICMKTRWRPAVSFEFHLLRPVVHFGWWMFLKTQTTFLTYHIEKIVIGRILGSYPLGLYDKSKSLAVVPSETVMMSINSVMFSLFSRNKYDEKKLNYFFAKSIAISAIVSCPIYAGLILVSPYFVSIFLGEKWMEMIVPLQIVLTGYLFKSFAGIITSLNVAVGRYRTHTLLTIVCGSILLVLCLLFIKYGIVGISMAFFLFCIVEFVCCSSLSILTLKIGWGTLLQFVFTGVWSSAVMFAVTRYLSFKYFAACSVPNMIMVIMTGSVCYAVCVLVDQTKYSLEFKRKIIADMAGSFQKYKRKVQG